MPRQFLLSSLIFALALGSMSLVPQHASPAVVDKGHEIRFGDSIEVWARVSTENPVEEARLIYTPTGERRISTYDYAEVIASESEVGIEGSIPTGGSSYLPPGTRLDVQFELRMADGATSIVELDTITYLDPTRAWTRLSYEDVPVELYHYGIDDRLARELMTAARSRLPGIADALGISYEELPDWVAVIYPDIGSFTHVFPPTSQAATDNRFFGGFAMGEYHVLVQASPSEERFVHELTHLVIDRLTSSPLAAPVPSWLHEGLADYFEEGSSAAADRRVMRADPEQIRSFSTMQRMPGRSEDISIFYPQSASFAGYLIETHGAGSMANTLENLDQGRQIEQAIEGAYGMTLDRLENDWRAVLGLPTLPANEGADPAGSPDSDSSGILPGSQSVILVSLLVGSAMLLASVWLINARLRNPHR